MHFVPSSFLLLRKNNANAFNWLTFLVEPEDLPFSHVVAWYPLANSSILVENPLGTRCMQVLLEPGQETLPNFLAEHRVDVICSLPSYEPEQTDRPQSLRVIIVGTLWRDSQGDWRTDSPGHCDLKQLDVAKRFGRGFTSAAWLAYTPTHSHTGARYHFQS